jgi:hypothetical protein
VGPKNLLSLRLVGNATNRSFAVKSRVKKEFSWK